MARTALKPEDALTVNCVKVFNVQFPHKIIIHVANERKTQKKQNKNGEWYSVEGNILKLKGVRKGVSDFFIPEPTNKHHGLWIELKAKTMRVKDGKVVGFQKNTLSSEQKEWLELMAMRGYHTALAYDVEEFITICKDYFNAK